MIQPGSPAAVNVDENWIMRQIQDIQSQLRELRAANPFAPMGIVPESGGIDLTGFLKTLRTSDGSLALQMDPAADAFIVYDGTGAEIARLGLLKYANAGNYGIEMLYSGSWVQVGAGNVDWSNISNKPGSYPPSGHEATHANGGSDRITGLDGSQVSSGQVPSAADSSGSSWGYNHAVAGTSFYALWIGNDAGNHFGTNTSSARGKTRIRRHRIDFRRLMKLKPVRYEKRANEGYTEYGLIAEQVLEAGLPEFVQWMNGKVHGLRYDLMSVALLEWCQHLQRQLDAIQSGKGSAPEPVWHEPEFKANNPPPHPEPLHPYTIEED